MSAPSYHDIFLAYTASSVPIVLSLDDAIKEEGFNPWRGELETLINSSHVEDPYQGICQCDAFVLILGNEVDIPNELEDELEQAIALNKLVFVVAQQPIKSDAVNELGLNKLTWLQVAVESGGTLRELASIIVNGLAHGRLLARAAIWKEEGYDPKHLLSIGDIESSLQRINWLKQRPDLGFSATQEQDQFLEISENQADKRKDYFQGKPPDIFISYCSKDRDFIKGLKTALEERELGIWVDFENIPIATDWRSEVAEAIRVTHTFVFVISPYSLDSNPCSWEIEQARSHNRRIIPICINHDFEQESLRRVDLAAINYISFKRKTFLDAVDELVQAIHTDLDDVKIYNQLYRQAFEWASYQRRRERLLSTIQFQEIAKWQKNRRNKKSDYSKLLDLQPIQIEYIEESQDEIEHNRIELVRRQKARRNAISTALPGSG